MNYIIEIKVDGVTTGVVGPFPDEGAADKYVSDFLEPHLERATFHITDVTDPLDFLAILLQRAGMLPNRTQVLAPIRPLSYFEDKYGPDFRKKLPLYRTAHLQGRAVSIMQLDMGKLEALVVGADSRVHRCKCARA